MNKKKAAILIAGLTRTYKKTKESFFSKLITPNQDEYDIDIYLCFWGKTHQRGMRENKNITELRPEDKKEILDTYKPKNFKILEHYDKANDFFFKKGKKFTSIVGRPKNHSHPDLLHQNGVMAQSYTWHSCFSLIAGKYDILLKTRFDSSYKKPLHLSRVEKNTIHCFSFTHQTFSHIGDAVFFGDQDTMKIACHNYHEDMINFKLPPMSKDSNLYAEDILHDYLKHHNIKINLTKKQIKIIK